MKSKLFKLAGALSLVVFFALTGCNKLPAPTSSTTVKNFRDLTVSPTFNWSTTKTVTVNVSVPSWAPYQSLKIYSNDNKVLYYAGFPDASGQVDAQITVPSATNMLKLVYGRGNLFKSILTGIDNQLSYNYNSFKDTKADPCDLSGEVSYSQGGWSSDPHGNNPGSILSAHFSDVFPHGLVIGDSSNYTMKFTSANAISNFLPGGGKSEPLTSSYTDPAPNSKDHKGKGKDKTNYGGNLGGQVVAAEINVAFSQSGYIGTNSIKLGDLVFKGGTPFDGMTVNAFLKIANKALGGGGTGVYKIEDIAATAELINTNFDGGKVPKDGYLTCPSAGTTCGCNGGLNSVTLKYTGSSAANIEVTDGHNKVFYSGTVDPDSTFTATGASNKNGKLGANIYLFVNGNQNTTIHVSCSQSIYKGDVHGSFTVMDGVSDNNIHICENPNGPSCGCDTKLYSLTLRYDGSSTANVKVEEADCEDPIYSGTVKSGDMFSFNGSGHDGALASKLYVYVNGSKNATIYTSCDKNPAVNDQYGDFTIAGGTSSGNLALCGTISSNPPGGNNPPPSGGGTTTSSYNGSLAFEDLWPYQGDYDFNDCVIDYNFATTQDDQNRVQSIKATFILHAFGASYHNGFGFQLPNVNPNQIISVTGYNLASDTYIHLASNGLEAGHSKATVIVYDDAWRLMPYQGGIGVNTQMAYAYDTPDTLVINMTFYQNGSFAPGGAITYNQLDIGKFNPFIIVNKNRTVEVHLPNYAPTSLANKSLLGTGNDASDPSTGTYYVTKNNLPWAINIPNTFDYPIEKQDILGAYLHFADWAESDGTLFPEWYADKPGYRDASLIYKPH